MRPLAPLSLETLNDPYADAGRRLGQEPRRKAGLTSNWNAWDANDRHRPFPKMRCMVKDD